MAIKQKGLLLLLLLAGCTMGPDFKQPDFSAPSSWFRPQPAPVKVEPSTPVENEPINPDWWKALHDPQLNDLVARLASQNLDVQTATVRLQESRAERRITAADLYPQLDGDASYTREKISDKGVVSLISGGGSGSSGASTSAGSGSSGASAGSSSSSAGIPSSQTTPPFNVYQYGFDASWEIDLWGRVRRSVEVADANVQAAKEARRDIELSAIAELVRDYVQLRGVQANIAITQKNLKAAREIVTLTRSLAKAGLNSQINVVSAVAQAASTEAQLPPLKQQEAQLMNAIALLLAQPPGALEVQLSTPHPIPPVPPQVPVGVPSELLERRPDIREAEAQLHAATAEIGVAKANFFPQVTLSGNGMLQALNFSDLNTWAARSYMYGPSVSLPIFEGGRLVSTLQLRNDQQREAALQYQKTVLNAFHEVDNALTAYRAEQERESALQVNVQENQTSLALATNRYRQGLSNYINVLTAEQNTLASQQQLVASILTTASDMVQLYKALGGGWEIDFPERSGN